MNGREKVTQGIFIWISIFNSFSHFYLKSHHKHRNNVTVHSMPETCNLESPVPSRKVSSERKLTLESRLNLDSRKQFRNAKLSNIASTKILSDSSLLRLIAVKQVKGY